MQFLPGGPIFGFDQCIMLRPVFSQLVIHICLVKPQRAKCSRYQGEDVYGQQAVKIVLNIHGSASFTDLNNKQSVMIVIVKGRNPKSLCSKLAGMVHRTDK
jgi:hypothetical protein